LDGPTKDAIRTSNCIASNLKVIIVSPKMHQNYSTNYEKCGFKMQLMYLSQILSGPTEGAHNTPESAFRETVTKMFHGRLMHVDERETVTNLQILGCECAKMHLAAGLRCCLFFSMTN